MFLRNKRNKEYEKIYKKIMIIYFNYLHSINDLHLTSKGMSELLRYSLCNVLNLKSIYSDVYIESLSEGLESKLQNIISNYNILDKPMEYRQGLLEACVHCIEFSRKKAGYV